MVDAEMLQTIPDEVVYRAQLQVSQERLAQAYRNITGKAAQFLKFRALATSDAQARHMMGHVRKDGNQVIPCGCGVRKPGWTDLRESTVLNWKKNEHFMFAYQALLWEPQITAATRLEQLTPVAVDVYGELLDPANTEVKPSVRRLAAKDILEANGLKMTEGTNRRSAPVETSVQMRIARERHKRGMPLSMPQRQMLIEAGDIKEIDSTVVDGGVGAGAGPMERTLDGRDVPAVWPSETDDNSEFLPD